MKSNINNLFLFDSIGATLHFAILFLLIPAIPTWVGEIPKIHLKALALYPLACALYSFGCYRWKQRDHKVWLQYLIYLNLFYCPIAVGFVAYNFSKLSTVGFSYFVLEVITVLIIVFFEKKFLREQN